MLSMRIIFLVCAVDHVFRDTLSQQEVLAAHRAAAVLALEELGAHGVARTRVALAEERHLGRVVERLVAKTTQRLHVY